MPQHHTHVIAIGVTIIFHTVLKTTDKSPRPHRHPDHHLWANKPVYLISRIWNIMTLGACHISSDINFAYRDGKSLWEGLKWSYFGIIIRIYKRQHIG